MMIRKFNDFYSGVGFEKFLYENDGAGMSDGWGDGHEKRPAGYGDGLHINFNNPDCIGIDSSSPFYEE